MGENESKPAAQPPQISRASRRSYSVHHSAAQSYQYRHLPGPRYIRLLHVDAAQKLGEEITCSIEIVPFDSNPSYVALSYTWGNMPPSQPIRCDGHATLLVTPNCESALRHLRMCFSPLTIWIDAICINQGDNVEKEHQLKMMGELYKNAEHVAIWMGEATTDAELRTLQLCKEKYNMDYAWNHGQGRMPAWPDDVDHQAIRSIFTRPWFSRMWTVQESALPFRGKAAWRSERVKVYFGLWSWELNLFCAASKIFSGGFFTNFGLEITRSTYLHEFVFLRLVQGYNLARPYQSLRSEETSFEIPWLHYIMCLAMDKEAKVPHDKVYALYGLFAEYGADVPDADYAKPVQDVYAETAAMILDFDKALHVLYLAASRRRLHGLPSWVPSFDQKWWGTGTAAEFEDFMFWHGPKRDQKPYRASGTSLPYWRVSQDRQRLTVRGRIVGKVSGLGPVMNRQPGRLTVSLKETVLPEPDATYRSYQVIQDWMSLGRAVTTEDEEYYVTRESFQSAFCRTLSDGVKTADEDGGVGNLSAESRETWFKTMDLPHMPVLMLYDMIKIKALLPGLGRRDMPAPVPLGPRVLNRDDVSRGELDQEFRDAITYLLSSGGAAPFHELVWRTCQRRRFFVTDKGYMGLVPGGIAEEVEEEDLLVLVAGLDKPLILRPMGRTGLHTLVVFACYVHGLMDGEQWDDKGDRNNMMFMLV